MRVPISFQDIPMRNWARQNTLQTDENYFRYWISPDMFDISANVVRTTGVSAAWSVLQMPADTDEIIRYTFQPRLGWAAGQGGVRLYFAPSTTHGGTADITATLHYLEIGDSTSTTVIADNNVITMSGTADELAWSGFGLPDKDGTEVDPQANVDLSSTPPQSLFSLTIERDGDDGVNDTFTGDFEIYGALFIWKHRRET